MGRFPAVVVSVDRAMAAPTELVEDGALACARHPRYQDSCHVDNLAPAVSNSATPGGGGAAPSRPSAGQARDLLERSASAHRALRAEAHWAVTYLAVFGVAALVLIPLGAFLDHRPVVVR